MGTSRRKPRSGSQVRIRDTSPDDDSDGSVDGRYIRHRDGRVEFVPEGGSGSRSNRRQVDLEQKTAARNRDFRAKRDGYESDEGEMLRGSRRADHRTSRRLEDDVSYGRDVNPPHRPKGHGSRRSDSVDDIAAAAVGGMTAARRRRDEAYGNGRRRYDDDDRRRGPRVRDDRYEDRGYASDRPGRSSRYDRDGAIDRDSRRRPDPYQSDARRPRAHDPALRARYDDDPYYDRRGERGGLQRSRSERVTRDRHGDHLRGSDRYGSHDSRAGSKGGNQDWKKQAGAMFMTTAMPVIRREGTKFVKKELESYLAGKGR